MGESRKKTLSDGRISGNKSPRRKYSQSKPPFSSCVCALLDVEKIDNEDRHTGVLSCVVPGTWYTVPQVKWETHKYTELFTGHDPARGSGQEFSKTKWVGSSRVESSRVESSRVESSRVGSGGVLNLNGSSYEVFYSYRSGRVTLARSDPREMTGSAKSLDQFAFQNAGKQIL